MKHALVATLAASLAIACGSQDIVVADIPQATDGGSDSSPPGSSCATNDDCAPNAFCAKSSCDAPTGGCELRPLDCDSDPRFACGCDGVTYWNDCLRRRSGVASSVPDQCLAYAVCKDPDGKSCPALGASCARLVPPQAPCPMPMFPGACWVLPDTCPTMPQGPRPLPSFHECPLGPGATCSSMCDAIRSGTPHVQAPGPGCF
jgi:hypothetical protein